MLRGRPAFAALCGVAVSVAAVTLTSGPVDTSEAARCGDWPSVSEGRPAVRATAEPRYAVWHDDDGWHLRAVTPPGRRAVRFHGRIQTSRPIRAARARGREAGDEVKPGRRDIRFAFLTRSGDVDGFDFGLRCGSVRFRLRPRSSPVSIGERRAAPTSRFTVPDPGWSGVRGRVVIAPSCPVEGTGEDCSPQPLATTVDVNGAAGAPGRSVATDGSGRFRIELAPGRYQLAARPVDPIGSSQPADVTVTEGLVTEVTLTVDSGIR